MIPVSGRFVSNIVAELTRFLAGHPLGGGPGIVAVSGGADSVALLRGLVQTQRQIPTPQALCGANAGGPPTPQTGNTNLVVVHVNHLLRGEESDADAAFVQNLAASLGVECQTSIVDVTALGGNLEATARNVRYQIFAELAEQRGARWIATGHTADDQAETVLHRIIRGTGIQGLRGIAPSRDRIVRPMLRVTRQNVLAYLNALAQPYRTDSTNADVAFTRNRIRADLLPLLKSFNPEIVASLGRLAEQAEELYADLHEETIALLATVELPRIGTMVILDRTKLAVLSQSKIRSIFRRIWQREAWPMHAMTHRHWQRAAHFQPGDYPDGVQLLLAGKVLKLWRST